MIQQSGERVILFKIKTVWRKKFTHDSLAKRSVRCERSQVFICTAGAREREQRTGHEIKHATRGDYKNPTSSFDGQWDSTENARRGEPERGGWAKVSRSRRRSAALPPRFLSLTRSWKKKKKLKKIPFEIFSSPFLSLILWKINKTYVSREKRISSSWLFSQIWHCHVVTTTTLSMTTPGSSSGHQRFGHSERVCLKCNRRGENEEKVLDFSVYYSVSIRNSSPVPFAEVNICTSLYRSVLSISDSPPEIVLVEWKCISSYWAMKYHRRLHKKRLESGENGAAIYCVNIWSLVLLFC